MKNVELHIVYNGEDPSYNYEYFIDDEYANNFDYDPKFQSLFNALCARIAQILLEGNQNEIH